MATLTSVAPAGRFGALEINNDQRIESFQEKPKGDGAMINGGFFVLKPEAIDFVEGDSTIWERDPLEQLANSGNLFAFQHDGFWQPMDTLRDKLVLDGLLEKNEAPWKMWEMQNA